MMNEAGSDDTAILVGLDGWHLTRAQLDAMPDPKLARDFRGAHWTFDGESYASFIRSLRDPSVPTVTAPSFDHAVKDPVPHDVTIEKRHQVIVIEGLYAFLKIEPWIHAGELLDERWFVDVDMEEAKRRLVKRHIVSGVASDMDNAIWRADNNDMPSMNPAQI